MAPEALGEKDIKALPARKQPHLAIRRQGDWAAFLVGETFIPALPEETEVQAEEVDTVMMTAAPPARETAVPTVLMVIMERTVQRPAKGTGRERRPENSENRQENYILAAVEEELAEQRKRREKADLAEAGRARKAETLISVAFLTT